MLREHFIHDFHESVWNAAKQEVRCILIDIAKRRSVISHSDQVTKVRTCSLLNREVLTWRTCLVRSRQRRTQRDVGSAHSHGSAQDE